MLIRKSIPLALFVIGVGASSPSFADVLDDSAAESSPTADEAAATPKKANGATRSAQGRHHAGRLQSTANRATAPAVSAGTAWPAQDSAGAPALGLCDGS